MNSKKSALLSGTIAALIAIAVIATASSLGALRTTGSPSSTVQLQGATTQQVGATSGGSSKTGTLAVLMTDPPTVPSGVTAVYITYANLAIHFRDAGNDSGWHILNTQ